jgi:hypothetical protein
MATRKVTQLRLPPGVRMCHCEPGLVAEHDHTPSVAIEATGETRVVPQTGWTAQLRAARLPTYVGTVALL